MTLGLPPDAALMIALKDESDRNGAAMSEHTDGVLTVGDLSLDPSTGTVTNRGEVVQMAGDEFKVLHYLMQQAEPVDPNKILADIWGSEFAPGEPYEHIDDPEFLRQPIPVYVRYLRTRLDVTGEPSVIEVIRGRGYRLRRP